MAPLRLRALTTGFMGGETSSSRESDHELDFCCEAICLASSCLSTHKTTPEWLCTLYCEWLSCADKTKTEKHNTWDFIPQRDLQFWIDEYFLICTKQMTVMGFQGLSCYTVCIHTHLLEFFKVVSEKGHGPLGPRRAQLDDAVFKQLLNVVLLHILLTLSEALLVLTAGTAWCHLCLVS